MKKIIFSLAFLAAVGVVGPVHHSYATDRAGRVDSGDVKRETKEAYGATKEYLDEKKDDYLRRMEAELNELGRDIDRLEAKAKSASREARQEYREEIQELREKREAAARKLNEVKSASNDAWQDVKQGFQNAYDDLKRAYHDADRHS